MNNTTGIIIGVIALVIVAGGLYASMNGKNEAMMAKEKMEQQTMDDKKMAEEKAMMEKDETSMMDKGATMMKAGLYEAYTPDKLARAETGDVVLFFHASWCPSCRGLNADIEKNLSAIPSEVSILKVDYDTESELKKKYGVTYQHTLVQVAADGTMINKWSGSPTLMSLVSQIN